MACLVGTACHDATTPQAKRVSPTPTVSSPATLPPAPARFVLGSGGTAVWYNSKSQQPVDNVLRPEKAEIVATASLPSQSALASAYRRLDRPCLSVVESETIDTHGNLRLGTFPGIGIEPAAVTAIAVSPNGHFLAVGESVRGTASSTSSCTKPHIVVIDLVRGIRRQSALPWQPGAPVAKLAWSSDDQTIVAATPVGPGGMLDLWAVKQSSVGGTAVEASRTKLSQCAATDVAATATEMLVLLSENNCQLGRSLAAIDPATGAVRPIATVGTFPAVDRFSADRTGTHLVLFRHGQPAAYLWNGGVVTPVTTRIAGPIVAAAW